MSLGVVIFGVHHPKAADRIFHDLQVNDLAFDALLGDRDLDRLIAAFPVQPLQRIARLVDVGRDAIFAQERIDGLFPIGFGKDRIAVDDELKNIEVLLRLHGRRLGGRLRLRGAGSSGRLRPSNRGHGRAQPGGCEQSKAPHRGQCVDQNHPLQRRERDTLQPQLPIFFSGAI